MSAPPTRSLAAGRRFRLLKVYPVVARILASYGWLNLVKLLRGDEWYERVLPRWNRVNARRVLATVVDIQGLFIKVGQLISILSNFLPADFRDELEELQDRIPPRPFAEIRGRIRGELDVEAEELLAELDAEPIASASLAQVHAARLADGRRVAVKVQHLDIEKMARLDLEAIRRVLWIVQFFLRIRGLTTVYEEVREMILEELDFAKEANHLEVIGGNFEDDPMVSCPRVIRERSTPRVLTTDFVSGVKVSDLEALAARDIDRGALAERILRAYCQMIFSDGVYHADPHPGNILVRDDGGIVFVDFGAVARLSPGMKAGIPQFLEGVLKRDRAQIAGALRRMGFVQRSDNGDVVERVIEYFYSRFLEEIELDSFNLRDIHVDAKMKLEVMTDLARLDISFREMTTTFQVPREWILLQRTLLLLMGLCTHLDPQMRPAAVIRPYLEEFVLGEDRDWMGLAGSVVKDMALTALTLPDDLKRVLTKANRGELAVEIHGLREHTSLTYALGHQLLYGLFAMMTGGLAYASRAQGDEPLATALAAASGFFLLCLVGSRLKARKWLRKLRRGSFRG